MRCEANSPDTRTEAARGFERIADAIMYRWSVERDTWVSTTEVEQARAYLERIGVSTDPLPDGQFTVTGPRMSTVGAARLVLLGLKHLHAARHSRPKPSAWAE